MHITVRQLEAKKGPEYVVRVEEMEREGDLNTSTDISASQAKLKEVQDEMNSLRQGCQQREKEMRQQAEAIRRQDSAKSRDQIARLEAELSRVEAQSREKSKALEDLTEYLQAESHSRNGATRVLEFMMRNFAPVFRSRHDLRPLYVDERRMVMPPRRIGTSGSVQSMG